MNVCVLGLGNIGLPVVEYISQHGFQVYGYDVVEKSVDAIETFTDWELVPPCDVYVVSVLSNSVEAVCQQISSKNKHSLVCIESTVPVGTCRKIAEAFDLSTLVHCPHRLWIEDLINHGVKQLRVFGALNEASAQKGLDFYRSLDIPLHICASIELAEMCKIAENCYRFVQIAFAEELRMICESKGMPFDDVRTACNTKWNIEILEAREGILGECLPKDTKYLAFVAEFSPLIDGAILADENYRKWIKTC
jgi:UDP-N-acetyl-D-mannosaminuronate dehydrogenase